MEIVCIEVRFYFLDQLLSMPSINFFVTNLPKHLEFSKIDVIFAPRLIK